MKVQTEKYAAGVHVHRQYPRYLAPWKIIVTYKRLGAHEAYRGSVNDVSLGGVSFFSEVKIASTEPGVATVEIPALMKNQKNTLVEARCLVLHSINFSAQGKFRTGIKFIDFTGKGRETLTDALNQLTALPDDGLP